MSTDQLTAEAVALPENERRQLLHAVLDTMPGAPIQYDDEEVLALASRRAREIDEGKVECIPHEEAMRQIRERLRCK